MKTIKYIFDLNRKIIISIWGLVMLAVCLEAISTYFLPMIIIQNTVQSSRNILLLVINGILCVADILFTPLLKNLAAYRSAKYNTHFRKEAILRFIEGNREVSEAEKFKSKLMVATDCVSELTNDNISQICYRVIYGIGSFIVVASIDLKVFLVIIIGGVLVTSARLAFQGSINKGFVLKSKSKGNIIELYRFIVECIYYLFNRNVKRRVINSFCGNDREYEKNCEQLVFLRGGLLAFVSMVCDVLLLFILARSVLGGVSDRIGLLFAVRPMINFFNYINITIASIRENLEVVSKMNTYLGSLQPLKLVHNSAFEREDEHKDNGIIFKQVSFSFGDKKVLDRFSYRFKYGHIYEIRGPKGAGKSTILKLIMGLLMQDQGTVEINGVPNINVDYTFDKIFYLPSKIEPIYTDLNDNIALGRSLPNNSNEVLKELGIDGIKASKPENFSTGECIRIAMARGLLFPKNIYLLDEFNSNLDEFNSRTIQKLIKRRAEEGSLIIIVNHKKHIDDAIVLEVGV